MATIPAREDSSDGEGPGGMGRRETVGYNSVTIVKGIAKVAIGRNRDGAGATGRFLRDHIDGRGVDGGFARKESGLLREFVLAPEADKISSGGSDGQKGLGIPFAENLVEIMIFAGTAEIGSVVWIGSDEPAGDGDDRECGKPVLSVKEEVLWKGDPHHFLVGENIAGQEAPAHVALGRKRGSLQQWNIEMEIDGTLERPGGRPTVASRREDWRWQKGIARGSG